MSAPWTRNQMSKRADKVAGGVQPRRGSTPFNPLVFLINN